MKKKESTMSGNHRGPERQITTSPSFLALRKPIGVFHVLVFTDMTEGGET
jgi:hypothetical protein